MSRSYQNSSFVAGDPNWIVTMLTNRAPEKYSLVILIIGLSLCAGYVEADNVTGKYLRVFHEESNHEPKFLTFNTEDDGDLTIDLEFAVPFLTIPVKKTVDHALGGLANINVGAVILGGIVILGVGVIFPLLTSLFVKHMMNPQHHRNDEPNDTWRIMTVVEQALIENNIDTTSCMQRTVCWLAKNSRHKLNSGQAASHDKIIDGLLSNPWLNQFIEGSAMQTAIVTGLENDNCSMQYKTCKISQKSILTFANKFFNYLKFRK